LRVLNYPFLALTVIALGRGWYLNLRHRHRPTLWSRRSRWLLVASTLLAGTLWGLRFAGLLGMPPF